MDRRGRKLTDIPERQSGDTGWNVPMEWYLLAAAKSRGKTIDEYIAGGWTRWWHVHKEIAFDILQLRLDAAQMDTDTPEKITKRMGRPRREDGGSDVGEGDGGTGGAGEA